MPTKDMQYMRLENTQRELIATTLSTYSLVELDAMFLEATENLATIAEKSGIESPLGHSAMRIREALNKSQESYDKYFANGRFNHECKKRIIRQFAFDLAKYIIFLDRHESTIKSVHPHIERKYLGKAEQKIRNTPGHESLVEAVL